MKVDWSKLELKFEPETGEITSNGELIAMIYDESKNTRSKFNSKQRDEFAQAIVDMVSNRGAAGKGVSEASGEPAGDAGDETEPPAQAKQHAGRKK